MIDTIIFDLDGTLLNTSMDLTNSVNYALKNNNLKIKTVEEVKASLGSGPAKLIEKTSGLDPNKDLFKKVLKEYLEHYNKNNNVETVLYEGVEDPQGRGIVLQKDGVEV